MKFSEYIVIESTGSSVDPLGFLRPSSAIADGLFKQFTVLSNHPAYQGFLAFVFLYLGKKGIRPGAKSFSKEFRDVEVLWGILNDRANVSILNVTKYAGIAKKPNVSLADARKYAPIYTKLNYGTLGHYSSPSIFWGILDGKGIHLTDLGESLGIAWSKRNGLDFGVMLDAWLSKRSVDGIENFSKAVEAFNLTAAASHEERDAWKEIIKAYCSKSLIVQPLWNRPVTDSIHALANDEACYSRYYQAIQEHYKEFTELCERIELARQFETLAALSQFVFEWEYVNRLDEVKKIGIVAPNVNDAVAKILVKGCTDYLKVRGSKDAGKMFQTIAQARNYEEIASTILNHHVAHQKGKGASPFVQGKEIIVPSKVDPKVFSTFFEILKGEPLATVRRITWRYRRNWHFQRASTWLNYSKDPV